MIVNYYDVILATVSVSCPEAARMVLGKKEPIVFAYTENEQKADTTGADWNLYNELINGLVITTGILQNRSFPIWERVYLVIQLSNQVQKHIKNECLDKLRKNIECYKDIAYCEMQLEEMRSMMGKIPGGWKLIHSMLEGIKQSTGLPIDAQKFIAEYIVLEATEEDKIAIVSKLSRVMEHSEMLDMYSEEILNKNELGQLYRLAYLLC